MRYYRFAEQNFKQVFAHGGQTSILTERVFDHQKETNCNFIDLTIVPPGGEIGIHTHELNNEEMYIVISGEGKMVMDGQNINIATGDVIFNRPGGTHGLWNTGDEEMKLVVVEIARGN
jgi:mannose-6-phosphate isomerase-like protein (cupin superfamily)